MSNWPGRKAIGYCWGATSTVTMSWVWCRTVVIWYGRLVRVPRVGASSAVMMGDLDELGPGELQALDDLLPDALCQGQPEPRIGAHERAELSGVELQQTDRCQAPGVEGPAVGREQPGPPEGVTAVQGLQHDRLATGFGQLQGHIAVEQQRQGLGRLATAQDEATDGQFPLARGCRHGCDVLDVQIGTERVPRQYHPQEVGITGGQSGLSLLGHHPSCSGLGTMGHGAAPASSEVRRITSTSSVRSMPTGHQVRHRPQPTHPEVSNWSIQVASLWVSHWR